MYCKYCYFICFVEEPYSKDHNPFHTHRSAVLGFFLYGSQLVQHFADNDNTRPHSANTRGQGPILAVRQCKSPRCQEHIVEQRHLQSDDAGDEDRGNTHTHINGTKLWSTSSQLVQVDWSKTHTLINWRHKQTLRPFKVSQSAHHLVL